MAINQTIPPHEHSMDSEAQEPCNDSAGSSTSNHESSSACLSDAESSIPSYVVSDRDGGGSEEDAGAMAINQQNGGQEGSISRALPSRTPAFQRVSHRRYKRRGGLKLRREGNSASMRDAVACLRQQLASLRGILPPVARSVPATNVIVEALKYKKALAKQLQTLQSAFPNSYQVNVERLGTAGIHIRVSCNKEPGLLVALMEALESFGLSFANMSISCLDNKIKMHGISTKGSLGERKGSLKVALMATIMHFTQKGGQERLDKCS